MSESLETIQQNAISAIQAATNKQELEQARIDTLGKKGTLSLASAKMKDLSNEEKPTYGAALNNARQAITSAHEQKATRLQEKADKSSVQGIDLTLPGRELLTGGIHPLTIIKDRTIQIFRKLGFALAEGPEIETEYYCFDALNTPDDHPARNQKDTFYFNSGKLLRTHTSSVQIHAMEKQETPIKIIAPGSAYRRDEVDATHLPAFNQIEGLYVDSDVSLADLKGTLNFFFRQMFGNDTEVRYRPHFFPFTEPSFEIDVKLHVKGQEPKWIEIAGCGMVDPAVFSSVAEKNVQLDPEKLTGFAFGMGLERLAMIQWGIKDIRLLIENDARFLRQFS